MYVQVHDTLLDHYKLVDLAAALKHPRVRVLGHLVTLWLNVGRHRPEGNVGDWPDRVLARYSDWRGEPKAWKSALETCGFITDGNVNDWQEYFSEKLIAARRKKDREKKRRQRGIKQK